ncbi:balbiani ring protein 3-like [Eleutherodactylus coqui]|uniref:balbiani ring protein 3-like n=1 Tax=Eleutherodactylus coqui TaxID=57060 RepID=UPI0034635470
MWKLSVILLISASFLHMIDAQDQQAVHDQNEQADDVQVQQTDHDQDQQTDQQTHEDDKGPEITGNEKNNCSENQHWNECGSRCPERCYNGRHIGTPCPKGCARGCFCNTGYIKESETSSHCIPPEDCPKINPATTPKPTEPECPENQHWTDCGTACPITCENVDNPPEICEHRCALGCFCEPPYVFLSENSKTCVLPEECPKPPEPECPKNQHWSCGTTCPITCENMLKPPKICTLQCVFGCFCEPPYIFLSENSKTCVLPEECPKPPEHNCPENQEWNDCGTSCPINCQNVGDKPISCDKKCVPGCFCREPFIFQSGHCGTCVCPEECPKMPATTPKPTVPECPEDQEWSECGAACPKNCENVGNKNRICPLFCMGACVCCAPLVFQSGNSGPCVPPQACPLMDPVPPPESECGENQHWENEGTLCPHNCQNRGALIKCKEGKVAGCFCNEGCVFLTGESGPCVRTEDCPKNNPVTSPKTTDGEW